MTDAVSPEPLHFDASMALLRSLAGPHGIHASSSSTANYRAVFARDAVMAGVAGLLAGDATITEGLVRTLRGLRDVQGPEGQIASNYEMSDAGAPMVSFGTLAPRFDGATWYLVGVGLAARAGALDPAPFRDSAARTVRLLDGIEYNGRHLLYVPTGGNWADEYVYDGYILYDQVLRAWGLRLLGDAYDEPAWLTKADAIEQAIETRFRSADGTGHPIASFTPVGARDTFDLAACSLLAVSGVAPALGGAALGWIAASFLDRALLPPAFHPVIDETHPDWPALSRYHLHGFRNRPHEYHNGGVWPIWLGWLALGLAHAGRAGDLARLRDTVRDGLGALPRFDFEEYLHGVTGAPGGTTGMAYTATGLVFLALADAPAAHRLFAR